MRSYSFCSNESDGPENVEGTEDELAAAHKEGGKCQIDPKTYVVASNASDDVSLPVTSSAHCAFKSSKTLKDSQLNLQKLDLETSFEPKIPTPEKALNILTKTNKDNQSKETSKRSQDSESSESATSDSVLLPSSDDPTKASDVSTNSLVSDSKSVVKPSSVNSPDSCSSLDALSSKPISTVTASSHPTQETSSSSSEKASDIVPEVSSVTSCPQAVPDSEASRPSSGSTMLKVPSTIETEIASNTKADESPVIVSESATVDEPDTASGKLEEEPYSLSMKLPPNQSSKSTEHATKPSPCPELTKDSVLGSGDASIIVPVPAEQVQSHGALVGASCIDGAGAAPVVTSENAANEIDLEEEIGQENLLEEDEEIASWEVDVSELKAKAKPKKGIPK